MDILSELIIAKVPLTAYELAERLRVPVGRFHAYYHNTRDMWWKVQQDGIYYFPRKFCKARMPKVDYRDKYGEPISRSKYVT